MTLEFSQQIFKKSSNITCHENSSSGSEVVQCVWMDRYTDTMKLISPFAILRTSPRTYISKSYFHWLAKLLLTEMCFT